MLKYNSILIKIKLFYLIITRKFNKIDAPINLSSNNKINVKNILIFFPIKDEDFRVAIYAFRKLIVKENVNYYYMINCIHRQHFHLKGYVYDMRYNIKNNKIKIDETFAKDRTLNKKYDIVVDLNKDFSYNLSLLINNLKSNYKIGIKKDYSDYLYNIQYDYSSSGVLEKIYNQIFQTLD